MEECRMTTGYARAGFDLDLRAGELREDAFGWVLQSKGVPLIECKADRRCRQTGNLFIEIEQRGRPSGLATSKSHVYAFEYLPWCWLVVDTRFLRATTEHFLLKRGTVMGGDFNRYRGVLVPIEALVRPAVHIPSFDEAAGVLIAPDGKRLVRFERDEEAG